MTLKNAALLALVGSGLVALLVVWNLVKGIEGVAEGVLPVFRLAPLVIYAFGGVSLAIYFYVRSRSQS